MLAKEHIDELLQRNGNVLTTDGDKIGSIGQVYADDDNGQPTWVTAKTGLFGTSESFVPLEGARVDGGDILVPYTKDQVKDAPRVDTDGHLDPPKKTGSTPTTVCRRRPDVHRSGSRPGRGQPRSRLCRHRSWLRRTRHLGPHHGRCHDSFRGTPERRHRAGSRRAGAAAQVRHHGKRHPDRSGTARTGPD